MQQFFGFMMPEGIASKFVEAFDPFHVIIGQPITKHLVNLSEVLYRLLPKIKHNPQKSKHRLVGIIYNKADYASLFGSNFLYLNNKITSYDNSIASDAKPAAVQKAKKLWEDKLLSQGGYAIDE